MFLCTRRDWLQVVCCIVNFIYRGSWAAADYKYQVDTRGQQVSQCSISFNILDNIHLRHLVGMCTSRWLQLMNRHNRLSRNFSRRPIARHFILRLAGTTHSCSWWSVDRVALLNLGTLSFPVVPLQRAALLLAPVKQTGHDGKDGDAANDTASDCTHGDCCALGVGSHSGSSVGRR